MAKMSIGDQVYARRVGDRNGHASGARPHTVIDERVEAVLHDMTIDELRRLQATLYEVPRAGLPLTTQIAKSVEDQSKEVGMWLRCRETCDEAGTVGLLLGAVAVAIAWWTYRAKAAPVSNIHQVIETVDGGHPYLLPIPRSDPCFCGSGTKFKSCHGRPPSAAPLMMAELAKVVRPA